jgi:hypothetical protein
MPEPSFLSWGSTPHRTDTVNTLLKRIAGGIANGGGGGGGGTTEVYAGNYGGAAPGFVPAGSAAIATDTSNGTQWNYYSGSWH